MLNPLDYDDMDSLLAAAVGAKESVYVVLQNGQTYLGKAAGLRRGYFVLATISGKEFYDAFIRLDQICSVEVRARESLK